MSTWSKIWQNISLYKENVITWWLSISIYSSKFHPNLNISYEFWIAMRLVLDDIVAIYQQGLWFCDSM